LHPAESKKRHELSRAYRARSSAASLFSALDRALGAVFIGGTIRMSLIQGPCQQVQQGDMSGKISDLALINAPSETARLRRSLARKGVICTIIVQRTSSGRTAPAQK
jgi:hypothetical protein